MSDQRQMFDLAARIHAKLAGQGCCEGFQHPGIDAMRNALVAVLGCHPSGDGICMGCGETMPCREVRFIAQALGVEA